MHAPMVLIASDVVLIRPLVAEQVPLVTVSHLSEPGADQINGRFGKWCHNELWCTERAVVLRLLHEIGNAELVGILLLQHPGACFRWVLHDVFKDHQHCSPLLRMVLLHVDNCQGLTCRRGLGLVSLQESLEALLFPVR